MPHTCVHKKVFKLENYENKVLNFVVFKMKVNSMYHVFAHKAVIEGMYGFIIQFFAHVTYMVGVCSSHYLNVLSQAWRFTSSF